jgi:hypothetical protein
MSLGIPVSKRPSEPDRPPAIGMDDDVEKLVDTHSPHIHSAQPDTRDEENKFISKIYHHRLLLFQVARLVDKTLVYYGNQFLWVYVKGELKSATELVFNPIETMFRGLWGKLQWLASDVRIFNVGSGNGPHLQ